MRLNKLIRSAILDNWATEKWDAKIFKERDALVGRCKKAVKCGLSGFDEIHSKLAIENMMVSKVGCFYINGGIRDLYYKGTCLVTNRHNCDDYYVGRYAGGRSIESEGKSISKLLKEYETERLSLRGILYSVTTFNRLLELLPEIEKYMPKKQNGCTTLVPVSEIAKIKAFL